MLIRLVATSLLALCGLALALAMAPAQAALVIQGARVIYDETRGEATVQMQYIGQEPTLLQVWLDPATGEAAPGTQKVPFILSPALTRLEPGEGQAVRILRTGLDGLAQDRETLLYFNTLEVPPVSSELVAAGEPHMQFSIRGRLKFFYRPKGLTPRPDAALDGLQFSLADALPDGRMQVRIHNPTPYHVTFSELALRAAADRAEADSRPLLGFNYNSRDERMVAPMDELLLALDWVGAAPGAALPAELKVHYTIINDAGGLLPREQGLNLR